MIEVPSPISSSLNKSQTNDSHHTCIGWSGADSDHENLFVYAATKNTKKFNWRFWLECSTMCWKSSKLKNAFEFRTANYELTELETTSTTNNKEVMQRQKKETLPYWSCLLLN